MTKTITVELRTEDAEPILRKAAEDAAKFGAWCDFITPRTADRPSWGGMSLADAKKEWFQRFVAAKRMVRAFGVDYEQTSEGETLSVHWPDKVLKSHLVKIAGMTWRHIDKSVPDPKRACPDYRRGVHEEACRQAADRVVRRWRAMLAEAKAA